MSVNLHLTIIVKNHRADRVEAIADAVRQIIVSEGLEHDLPPLTEDKASQSLVSRTNPRFPVIISRADHWAKGLLKSLNHAVAQANGEACDVQLNYDDADLGRTSRRGR